MKKKTLREIRERRANFKAAYYAELQKQGIVDEPEKKLEDMTKKELIELANKNGGLDNITIITIKNL